MDGGPDARREYTLIAVARVWRQVDEPAAEATEAEPPEFVSERLDKLGRLIEMLGDTDWRLEGRDRARIVDALAYLVEELKHVLAAYEDFCAFRKSGRKKSGTTTRSRRQPDRLDALTAPSLVAL